MTTLSFVTKSNPFYLAEHPTVRDLYGAVLDVREHIGLVVDEVRVLGYRESEESGGIGKNVEYRAFLSEISLMTHYDDELDRGYRIANRGRIMRWMGANKFQGPERNLFVEFGSIVPENQDVQLFERYWRRGSYINLSDNDGLLEVRIKYVHDVRRFLDIPMLPVGEKVVGTVEARGGLEGDEALKADMKLDLLSEHLNSRFV